MEQVLAGFSGMADSYMLEWLAAVCLILVAVAMALFDLPGNTLMAGCCLGFAFYDPSKYFDIRIISAVILIYALGEIWEFVLSFFGIKRQVKDISWWGGHNHGNDSISRAGQCDWRRDRRVCHGVSVRISAVQRHAACRGIGLAGGKDAVCGDAGKTGGDFCSGNFAGASDFLLCIKRKIEKM